MVARGDAGFQRVDGLMARVLKNKKGMQDGGRVGRLRSTWPTVVGRVVAGHTVPAYLNDAVLTLFVDEAAWLTELNFQRPALVERINEWAGGAWLRDIRLVQHLLPVVETPAPSPVRRPVDAATRGRACTATADLMDEELREVLARTLAAGGRSDANE
jgi:predicted nucleic acid-binding Zn ribbon protein